LSDEFGFAYNGKMDRARMKSSSLLFACVVAAMASAAGPARAEGPRRVVSFNLCADQLVLALADPGQIAGLSPYAGDPALSVMAEEARQYRRLDWQAEAAIPLHPDLVLIGSWDRPATQRMLGRLGVRVENLDLVSDLAGAKREIIHVAGLLGHAERGAALIAKLDAARARLSAVAPKAGKTALVIERGGFTAGPATLAATLLHAANFTTPSGAPANFGGFLPLEKLLMLKPDVVFLKDPPRAPQDQGAVYITHPALQALYPPQRRIDLPTRFTMCGGPALIAAFDYLADTLGRIRF
jgi:iron complex transport system substrate-binding protein